LKEGDSRHWISNLATAASIATFVYNYGNSDKSKPRPSKSERVGHPEKQSPEKLNQFLGVDVLEWYHPIVSVRQQKKYERVGHPPQHYEW
jgi:hypothetical protein